MITAVRTRAWLPEHVARIGVAPARAAAIIRTDQVTAIAPGLDVWDLGPVRTPDGGVAAFSGAELWIAISAPATGHPGGRHDIARLRFLLHEDGAWTDAGPLFPDGASLGSREWAASGTLDPAAGRIEVLYTAAGWRDRPGPRFEQRIVATATDIGRDGAGLRLGPWDPHRVVLEADGVTYMPADAPDGEPGFIKAFRDPYPVRDPRDGTRWVLFAGSLVGATTEFNGAVGVARREPGGSMTLHEPLLTADGVNNELERPHIVEHDGLHYLFFSTQRRTFAPGVSGPNGLYGFVSDALLGPYEPVNGSGLVMANPDEEPYQAYSWLVLPDLTVASFVDMHSLGGRSPGEVDAAGNAAARRHFGGTIAPFQHLEIHGSVIEPVV
ncbi:MAG: glycoside hydrolase family 68 protein [Thermoleophilia bacterium]